MPSGRDKPPSDPVKFEEAIRAWERRIPLPDGAVAAMNAAEGKRAFTVAGVAQADLVQAVYDEIGRAIRDGTTLADFKEAVGAGLEDAWGEADSYKVETIFRTSIMSAYNEGRQETMTAPAVKEARGWWRFDEVLDSRTSDICDELDGTVLPADDPFWATHSPPLHPNCRTILVPLTDEEAGEEGIDDTPDPEGAPAEGFGIAPDVEGADWEPNYESYDPALAEALRNKIG